MTDDKKEQNNIDPKADGLDFKVAQNMTVGEAVRKDSEIKAGVTETDSVLDKYIKQHRDEVVSQKFETKLTDFDNLDNEVLDDFIKKQRKEIEETGLLKDINDVNPSLEERSEKTAETRSLTNQDTIRISGKKSKDIFDNLPNDEVTTSTKLSTEVESEALVDVSNGVPVYKNKRVIIGGLVALVVVIIGVAYGLNYLNQQADSNATSSSTSKESSTTSSEQQAKADSDTFDELYASFFTDDSNTKLKNSEFGKLSNLEEALKKLDGTDYYTAAKEKYDSLSKQISSINAVNALFESDIVSDGSQVSATVKSDADFNSLSSTVLNTGNANLDTLLQSAISDGKNQLETSITTTSPASSVPVVQTEPETTTGAVTIYPASGASNYGITNYDSTILQRNLSRVPYNDLAIADSGNSAWTFTDGVLEKIVATSNARGYFSGNNYILEKVNIINGNGYYNMFKSDGTYLFSINCKTGYFVGNASGNSDALDY